MLLKKSRRQTNLETCRGCIEMARRTKDERREAEWKALLHWLEGNKKRVLPSNKEELIAALADGYPQDIGQRDLARFDDEKQE